MADGAPYYGCPVRPLMADGCWRNVNGRPCGAKVSSERVGLCARHTQELRSW